MIQSRLTHFSEDSQTLQTRDREHGTLIPVHHLSITPFTLFIRYPTYNPHITHLINDMGYRWDIGGL